MGRTKASSERERRARSRLHFLIRDKGLLRASLLTLETRCGKPNCRCAQGERHQSRVVEQGKQGKTRMRTVPPAMEEEIEQWVGNWREVQQLLEDLSEVHWLKLEARKKK